MVAILLRCQRTEDKGQRTDQRFFCPMFSVLWLSGGEDLLEPVVARQLAFAAGCFLDELLDHRVGSDPLGGGREVRQDTVPQHRVGERLDVVDLHVSPAFEQCAGLAAEDQVLHRTRTGAPAQPFLDVLRNPRLAHARLADQGQRIVDDVIGHRHLANQRLQLENLVAREDRRRFVDLQRRRAAGDLELLVEARVLHEHLEHEAVLLRLGERVGPFLFDRVLRRQDEEWIRKPVPHAADGDLTLLHGFEQRRLSLGRRAVDFVRENHIGEQRAGEELELARPGRAILLDDLGPGDVGGHQVRGELDTAKVERQAFRQGRDHERLGQARDAFENAVPLAEERDQQLLDDLVLAYDHARKLLLNVVKGALELFHRVDITLGQAAVSILLGHANLVVGGNTVGWSTVGGGQRPPAARSYKPDARTREASGSAMPSLARASGLCWWSAIRLVWHRQR